MNPAHETKTLRDEFAMAALTGILTQEAAYLSCVEMASEKGVTPEFYLATNAYGIADALLEARKK